MQVQSSMALIDNTLKNISMIYNTLKNISMTLYDGRHKTDGTAKKADQKSGIQWSWSCGFNHQWL